MKKKFQPRRYAVGFFSDHFQVIIDETESAEIDHAEESEPDETIIRPRPKDTGDENRTDDENAAHGRRSLFAAVQFGKSMHFFGGANRLADFQRDQFADDEISEEKGEHERGDRRRDRAKCDVGKDVEAVNLLTQVMEVVHHEAIPSAD